MSILCYGLGETSEACVKMRMVLKEVLHVKVRLHTTAIKVKVKQVNIKIKGVTNV